MPPTVRSEIRVSDTGVKIKDKVSGKESEKESYVSRKAGSLKYFLSKDPEKAPQSRSESKSSGSNAESAEEKRGEQKAAPSPGDGLAMVEALVKDTQFLYTAILFRVMFSLAVSNLAAAGAVMSRHTVYALVMSLHSYFTKDGDLEFIEQLANEVRFRGHTGFGTDHVDVVGQLADVKRIVKDVLTEVEKVFTSAEAKADEAKADEAKADEGKADEKKADATKDQWQKLKALAEALRNNPENRSFVKDLAETFELTFAHHLKQNVLTLAMLIAKEAARRCNDGDGWHGVTEKKMCGWMGLSAFKSGDGSIEDCGFDLQGANGGDVREVNKAALEAAKDACAFVRDTIGRLAGVTKTSKGYAHNDVRRWFNGCTARIENYAKLLVIVKQLQQLWRQYKPAYRGVLLYPMQRKAPMLRFPNSCFKDQRGLTKDWPEFFELHGEQLTRLQNGKRQAVLDGKGKPMLRMPPFDKFRDAAGKFIGGIQTDGKTLYVYGERPVSQQQRTKERSEAELEQNKLKIKSELDRLSEFWVKNGVHALKGVLVDKVVRPYGEDNFTGIVSLEKLCKAMAGDKKDGCWDTNFCKGRVVVNFDLGEKQVVAGHIIIDGVRFHSFRFSSRSLYKKSGRDEKEQSGKQARAFVVEEFGATGYMHELERRMRAEPAVQAVPVDMARLAEELPAMMKQNDMRANARWKVHLKQEDCFEEILRYIVTEIEIAQRVMGATKKAVIFIGDHYGPSKGAKGTRGHLATPLVKYLAQFLLLVTVPEHNTTKLCPLCHCPAEYANKKTGIRSFVCKACPVAGKDFFYDRDYGAASSIHYKAEFYIRSGGLYPAEFITIKERRKTRGVVG